MLVVVVAIGVALYLRWSPKQFFDAYVRHFALVEPEFERLKDDR